MEVNAAFWRAASCKTHKIIIKKKNPAKTGQNIWQLKKKKKNVLWAKAWSNNSIFPLQRMNDSALPLDIHLHLTVSFLLFLHLCRREASRALWPLTVCVRRETCVSLWLPLWQTEECMSFSALENRLRQLIRATSFTPSSSLLLALPAHRCCSACYKKTSHWKTLRSKLFE